MMNITMISPTSPARENIKPADRELLIAIESAFAVDANTAFHWLQNINMKALQAELIEEH